MPISGPILTANAKIFNTRSCMTVANSFTSNTNTGSSVNSEGTSF